METCESPRKVMQLAHDVARHALPDYASKFSRHDFTLAQLFACLVVREMLGLSYRKAEATLADTDWCQALGMPRAPDHSTLCRAFKRVVTSANCGRMLDLFAAAMARARALSRTLAVDSTQFDTHRRSRHYERRCRDRGGSLRSRTARRTPKLAFGACVRTHLILSSRPRTGMGSDAPDFAGLLYRAWRRHRVREVLADAGYDSEANHRSARLDMGVRSLIKAGVGRPSDKPAAGRYRRLMQRRLAGSQRGRPYGQRAQAETVVSMLKRNLGDSLRARTTRGRKMELLLKVLAHNAMVRRRRGSQQSRSLLISRRFSSDPLSALGHAPAREIAASNGLR
jgi:hypothetical protein